jgi:hypothetical protein
LHDTIHIQLIFVDKQQGVTSLIKLMKKGVDRGQHSGLCEQNESTAGTAAILCAYKGRTELDINPALGRNWKAQIGRTVTAARIKDQRVIRLDNNKKGLSVGFGID